VRRWTAEEILAAASDWAWVPPDASQVLTDEYQLVCYPERYHTFDVQVLWSRSARPADDLLRDVAGHVRTWGHSHVYWRVSDATSPAGMEAALRARGAALAEACQVLAYDMTDGLPDLSPPPGVRPEVVRDEAGVRAGQLVHAEVWGNGREPDEAEIGRQLADVRAGLTDCSDFRVLAFVDGQPASFGGCTRIDGVAQLWGAATRAAFRGRGGYRAVLAARMAVARERDATLALVKGRVETSAPILRRAGFAAYGEERCYRLDL
jgi:hypothetical protein